MPGKLSDRVEALERWAESLPYRYRPSSRPQPSDRPVAEAEADSNDK